MVERVVVVPQGPGLGDHLAGFQVGERQVDQHRRLGAIRQCPGQRPGQQEVRRRQVLGPEGQQRLRAALTGAQPFDDPVFESHGGAGLLAGCRVEHRIEHGAAALPAGRRPRRLERRQATRLGEQRVARLCDRLVERQLEVRGGWRGRRWRSGCAAGDPEGEHGEGQGGQRPPRRGAGAHRTGDEATGVKPRRAGCRRPGQARGGRTCPSPASTARLGPSGSALPSSTAPGRPAAGSPSAGPRRSSSGR